MQHLYSVGGYWLCCPLRPFLANPKHSPNHLATWGDGGEYYTLPRRANEFQQVKQTGVRVMVIEHGNKSTNNDGFELDLSQEHIEPMLQENLDRFVLFPIQHAEIWEMYKLHAASFWTAEEIDLAEDAKDWKSLSDDERHFLKHVLAFFAASDGIVNENLVTNFADEVQWAEVKPIIYS